MPYVKTWAVLPAAIFAAILFTRLCSRFGFRRAFNVFLGCFTVYFTLFVFILYPNREVLFIGDASFAEVSSSNFGFFSFLAPLVKRILVLVRFWPVTSFYVASELWSSITLAVLFWGFANQVTKFSEAKKFYGWVNFFGNLSGIVASSFTILFNYYSREVSADLSIAWDYNMYGSGLLISLFCCAILILFNYSYKRFVPASTEAKPVLKKKKNWECLKRFVRLSNLNMCFPLLSLFWLII